MTRFELFCSVAALLGFAAMLNAPLMVPVLPVPVFGALFSIGSLALFCGMVALVWKDA